MLRQGQLRVKRIADGDAFDLLAAAQVFGEQNSGIQIVGGRHDHGISEGEAMAIFDFAGLKNGATLVYRHLPVQVVGDNASGHWF